MTVYFQHVGESGGARDFPRTIGTTKSGLVKFSFADVESHLLNLRSIEREVLKNDLTRISPNGFQVWGIPSGAQSVLKNLTVGDYLLLLESVGPGGSFAYGGRVIAFPSTKCFDLSQKLWGEQKFPLIVFLKGALTSYTWPRFCNALGYKENWNPAGQTYRVTETKMLHGGFTDDEQLVETIVGLRFTLGDQSEAASDSFEEPAEEFFSALEGRRLLREHIRRERSLKLVKKFKENLSSFECSVCGFDFEAVYGEIGRQFIEAHHVKPLAETTDVEHVTVADLIAVCSNCHRMFHRTVPALDKSELKKRLADALEKRSYR